MGARVIGLPGFLWRVECSGVSLSATLGAYSSYVRIAVVLSFDPPSVSKSPTEWREILDAAIRAFDPDHAVVKSNELLAVKAAGQAWDAGWLIYERGSEVQGHPLKHQSRAGG